MFNNNQHCYYPTSPHISCSIKSYELANKHKIFIRSIIKNRRKPLPGNRATGISMDAYFTKSRIPSITDTYMAVLWKPGGQNLILKRNMTIGYVKVSDYMEKKTPQKN